MIKSFRHGGIERFFRTGSKAGIQPKHAKTAAAARSTRCGIRPRRHESSRLALPPLQGELSRHYAVWVDESWRLTFTFDGEHAELVDYQDYH